jgi:hypothetical protein
LGFLVYEPEIIPNKGNQGLEGMIISYTPSLSNKYILIQEGFNDHKITRKENRDDWE